MDIRWRFLYYSKTENAGTHAGSAGRERKYRYNRRRRRRIKEPSIQGRDVERNKVAKRAERVPRNAAIVLTVPVP